MLAEHEYNNPIALAFIGALTRKDVTRAGIKCSLMCPKHQYKLKGDVETSTGSQKMMTIETYKSKSQRQARTRWFLAVTLIHNPMLRQVRTCSFKAVEREDSINDL